MTFLHECLKSMSKDSANPCTANWAVDKEILLLPLESPATEDKIVMCPLPARCIHGKTASNNYDTHTYTHTQQYLLFGLTSKVYDVY